MLEKVMSKLGWYLDEPHAEPTFGKLDEYTPLTKKELKDLQKFDWICKLAKKKFKLDDGDRV
jgi:hypothetical protein